MSKELVISANRHETRVAILEDDQVVEVYHQRENEYSLAGSIHKGKVTRVLPGMQSAFVDIGLERDAFLYVSDFFEDNEEYDKIVTSVEEKVLKLDRVPPAQPAASEPAPPVAAEAAPATESAEPVAAEASTGGAAFSAPALVERRDRDDRDRRGRRGRRRRGQKGGRGLPESKFYAPRPDVQHAGQHGEQRVETHAQSGSERVRRLAPQAEDFLVLPGESLAKYGAAELSGAADAPPRGVQQEEAADPIPERVRSATDEILPPVERVAEVGAVPELPREIAEQPPEEPLPELAAAVEEAVEEAREAHEPASSEPAEIVAETADEVDVIPGDAAEPLETAEAVPLPEAGAEGPLTEAVPADEQGPEPARIPTSLTATLREQGPRYLHRVSRRMRRRGREGREAPHGAPCLAETARGTQTQEARAEGTAPRPEGRPERGATPSIGDLLREGQEIIVQIAKEPLGQKGARITSHIALPGRFLVYMPTVDHIGVSRKIPSDEERSRLKRVLQSNRSGIPGGYIVRTAGEGHSEEELRADMMFLYNLWLDLRQKAERKPAPALIHHDLNVVERVLRDQLTSAFKNIWVDNEELYESVLRFVQRFQPALVSRVKLYTRTNPIFEEFGITAELEKALRPKVWLKSGGYIVINQTEALVAIDVNTGKFVGKSNRLEDTIVKTNTDAIREIVRQVRLRDLGGIIVVDFIDMDERKNRQKVMQALEEAMRVDRAPYKILQFNDFGLVAITRKRVKQSLERTLCTPCPYCEGAGYVKSPQTVVGEILQEAHKIAKAVEGKDVLLRVAPDVARLLKSHHNNYLQELEEILGRTVIVKGDSQLHQEKFDLA